MSRPIAKERGRGVILLEGNKNPKTCLPHRKGSSCGPLGACYTTSTRTDPVWSEIGDWISKMISLTPFVTSLQKVPSFSQLNMWKVLFNDKKRSVFRWKLAEAKKCEIFSLRSGFSLLVSCSWCFLRWSGYLWVLTAEGWFPVHLLNPEKILRASRIFVETANTLNASRVSAHLLNRLIRPTSRFLVTFF